MAKKQNFTTDDYDFDSELEMPDFGFDTPEIKDDRTPISKFKNSFIDGAKDAVVSPDFVRSVVKKSLPRGYGSAMDLADQTAGSLKSLYNTTAKEIKPAINELKRTTKRVVESTGGLLPKSVADRLKIWGDSADKETSGSMSKDAQRDASISMELGSIFKAQTEESARQSTEQNAKDAIRDGIEQARYREQSSTSGDMRTSLRKLADYQDNVLVNYHRKSLELQYRHYFVAMDQLEEQKKLSALTQTNLEGILKNTGLPDFVKMQNREVLKQTMRNKFMDALDDGLFGKRRNFIRNVGDKIGTAVKDKVGGFVNDVRSGLSMADMMLDQKEMMAELGGGPDAAEMAGNMAGGLAADNLGTRLGKFLGKKAQQNQKIVKVGNDLQYGIDNLAQGAGQLARTGDATGFLPKKAADFLSKITPNVIKDILSDATQASLTGPDTSLERDSVDNLQAPLPFSRQASKTLTEIIPGYLARIHREIKVLRTGDDKAELLSYDFTTNRFDDRSKVAKNAFNSLFSRGDGRGLQDDTNDVINSVKGDTELTPEEHKALAKFLVKANLDNQLLSPEFLSDSWNYSGTAARHGDKFAEMFGKHFKDDSTSERKLKFGRDVSRLGSGLTDSRKQIQNLANAGLLDVLEEAGLVKGGSINLDRVHDYHLGDEYSPSAPAGYRKVKRKDNQTTQSEPKPSFRTSDRADYEPPNRDHPQPTQPVWTTQNVAPAPVDEKLLEAIKGIDTRDVQTKISETLLRIETQLQQGIVTFGAYDIARSGNAGNVSWLNKTVGQNIRDLFSFGKSFAGKAVDKFHEKRKQLMDLGSYGFDKAKEYGGKAKDWFKDRSEKFNTVYIKGQLQPALEEAKLKAGLYRDQLTGKVIESYKDITGAVVDENGNVVIRVEDLKNLYTKSRFGQTAVKLSNKAKELVSGLYSRVKQVLPPMYQFGLDMADKALKLTLHRPEDVYVVGKRDPVLLGKTMASGGYRSSLTGKVISHPGEIDSAVLDHNDQIALSTEELKSGLLDKNGKPLRTGLAKITGFIKDTASMGLGFLKRGLDKAKGFIGGVGDWFKNFVLPDGILFSGGKTIVERLTEIRDLLDTRLPKRKRASGDTDGDGVRDGSYEDLKAKREAKEDKAEGKQGGSSLFSGLSGLGGKAGAGLKALFDRFGSGGSKEQSGTPEPAEGESMLSQAADAAELADGASSLKDKLKSGAGKVKNAGKTALGKAGSMAKTGLRGAANVGKSAAGALKGGFGGFQRAASSGVLSGAAKGAGMLGRGLLTAGKVGLGLGGTLLSGAAGAVGSSIVSTAVGGASLLGSAAMGTLGLIGSVIASPVFLTGAALAAVGAAGYYGYKYLNRKKLGAMSKVRYAQYGFPESDTDHLQQVLGLEDKLAKGIVWTSSRPELDDSKLDLQDIVKSFGVELDDEAAVDKWMQWFKYRFKPVFMVSLAAARALGADKKLSDADDFKPAERKTFFAVAKYADGPYSNVASPFTDLPSLKMGPSEVAAVIAAAQAELDKIKDDKSGLSPTPPVMATAGAAGLVTGKATAASASPSGPGGMDSAGMLTAGASKASTATALASAVTGGKQITVMGTFGGFSRSNTGQVDALTVIRYKTYGLPEMVLEKVRALDMLESVVSKDLSFNGTGLAQWSGSAETLLSNLGPAFGVEGLRNEAAYDWIVWFNSRFLPVYLNYAGALFAATKKQKPEQALAALNTSQEIDVATAIYTSKIDRYRPGSVWDVDQSPWPGFTLTNTPKCVEPNVQSLKELAKKMVLDEVKGKSSGTGLGSNNGEDSIVSRDPNKSFFGNAAQTVKNATSKAWSATKEFFGNAWEGAKSAMGFGSAPAGGGGSNMQAMGGAVTHPGKGTGGDINSLPAPKGPQGKWESIKDTIIGAARMVGVDEKLMATMAAVESGFNWAVKASTSSATGLFQFIKSTWDAMLAKYGPKYGIAPDTPPTDPRANALMGAEFLKSNSEALAKSVKRPLTDTDLYLAHFMGVGGSKSFGASNFLNAKPDDIAANLMPASAAANASIFYEGGNKKGTPRTVAQVYQEVNNRVRSKGKQFGLSNGSEQIVGKSTPAANAPVAKPPTVPVVTGAAADAVAATVVAKADPKKSQPTATAATTEPAAPLIPISDQSPSVTGPNKSYKGYGGSSVSAGTPSTTNETPAASTVSDAVREAGSGFAPISPRAQSINAQAQYQRESMRDSLGPVADTLQQSLGVQQSQLDVLQRILGLIGSKQVTGTNQNQPAASTPQVVRPSSAAPQAPISMKRA